MYAFALLVLIGQLPPAMPPLPVALTTAAPVVAPAPVADSLPAAGVLHSSAAFVAAVPMRPLNRSQQCAGGACQQPAQSPKRAVQQYREHRQQYQQPAAAPKQY